MGGKKTEYLNIIQANLSLEESVMAHAVSCWPYAVEGEGESVKLDSWPVHVRFMVNKMTL